MPTRLRVKKLRSVGVVEAGANSGAHIAFWKSADSEDIDKKISYPDEPGTVDKAKDASPETGGTAMPNTPVLADDVREGLDDAIKAYVEHLEKTIEGIPTQIEEAVTKAVAEADTSGDDDDVEKDDDEIIKGLTDEQRALFEKANSRAEAAEQKADSVEKRLDESLAKAERDAALAKAAEYPVLGGASDDDSDLEKVADHLQEIEKMAPATRDLVLQKLRSVQNVAKQSELFKQFGTARSGGEGTAKARADAAAAELRKADPKLTQEAAVAKAMEDDEELFKAVMDEEAANKRLAAQGV